MKNMGNQVADGKLRRDWLCYWILLMLSASVISHGFSQTVDAFDPSAEGSPSYINSFAFQPDGKMVVGGKFSGLSGVSISQLARFKTDGSLDSIFFSHGTNQVNCMAVQSDGKFLIGGTVMNLVGMGRNYIGRFLSQGGLDLTFDANPNGLINCIIVQPDGKVLVGGEFTTLRGVTHNRLGRFSNGSLSSILDESFNPDANGPVNCSTLLQNGKILIAGSFTTVGGQPAVRLARLLPDGTLDNSFSAEADSTVQSLAVQPDGGILVGGDFTSLNGQTRNHFGRLNEDGTLDPTFHTDVDGTVFSIALQADGKILFAGDFTHVDGQPRNYISRVDSSGLLDNTFALDADGKVYSLALQLDGKVLVGGEFTTLGNQSRKGIGRLNNTGGAFQNLAFDESTITWTWNGTSPELAETSFEVSTNGDGWINIGHGHRVANGWQTIPGFLLPSNSTIRARGMIASGFRNSSRWPVETVIGPLVITNQPMSRTNLANTQVTFAVGAEGTPPLSYQWRKNGTNLTVGGKFQFVTASTLTFSGAYGAEAGGYSVVVSNASGCLTSSVADLIIIGDPRITANPTNIHVSKGQNATFKVSAIGTTPFYQWRHEGMNLSGANSTSLTLTNVQQQHIGGYDVIVSNMFGVSTSAVASLTVNLSIPDFFNPNANGDIYAIARQTDGKTLVGGAFTTLGGQARSRIARLNSDGTLETNFNPSANAQVFAIGLQIDGKILVGGWFTSLGGQARTNLGRLNPDGSLDITFNPSPNAGAPFPGIYSMAIQSDGRILVGGSFKTLAGTACTNIGRLNVDGTLDPLFQSDANNVIYPMALQSDGKILVGGDFTMLGGQPRNFIGRLNGDGSLDELFNPGASSTVLCLAEQPDGKLLVGGAFTNLASQSRNNFGRLANDGTLDINFDPDANNAVRSFSLQTDGSILIGGSFTNLAGKARNYLGRINSDGSIDPTFTPGANASVFAITSQADGQTLVGGSFTSLGGQSRNRFGRLTSTGAATQSLTFDGSVVTWLRGGTGPEVWRTAFEVSTNGTSWINLGAGERIENGWQLAGLNFPSDASMRARGFVLGSRYNSSDWQVEEILGQQVIEPITILDQPMSRTSNLGTTASFSVNVRGSPPMSFQWIKDDAAVADGGTVSGVQKATLSIANVNPGNVGGYSVVISNASGSVTSQVATLLVADPFINTQPVSRTNNLGTVAQLFVFAGGSPPFSYQWWKDGAILGNAGNISGATDLTLRVNNVSGADSGKYHVVVTNINGVAISKEAVLTVVDPFITAQPSNQVVDLGGTVILGVSVTGSAPFNYQWRKNDVDIPDATNQTLSVVNAQPGDGADYHVLVTGPFSTTQSAKARLSVNEVFPNPMEITAGSPVFALASQPDGSVFVGGTSFISRISPDGIKDTNFNVQINGSVNCIAVQANEKILIGAGMISVNGQSRSRLARLHQNGTLDTEFNPSIGGFLLEGTASFISALIVQSDGKIIIAGSFTLVQNIPRKHIGRLHADGSLDTNFNPTVFNIGSSDIEAVALQTNGQILIGGNFISVNGHSIGRLARLNEDGTLDTSFSPGASTPSCLAIQPDSKILIGGAFTGIGGENRSRIARLNANGSLDLSFNPGANDRVTAFALQADGKIIVAGRFTNLGGQPRNYIGRLHASGAPDTSFGPSADHWVNALMLGENGKIWAGGSFTNIAGHSRKNIAYLNNTHGATNLLSSDGSDINWQRSGTSPEVWHTTFEVSTNSFEWFSLGAGTRVSGGWELTDIELPQNSTIRARGFVSAGYHNGSMGLVESILQITNTPLSILTFDSNFGLGTNRFGFNFNALPGQTVVIEGSSNLLDWISLETNTVNTNPFIFSDPVVVPRRFYRLRSE